MNPTLIFPSFDGILCFCGATIGTFCAALANGAVANPAPAMAAVFKKLRLVLMIMVGCVV
jgi:hypothetical protein